MYQLNNFWEGDHLSSTALTLIRSGDLSPAEFFTLESHLASCQHCRKRLDAQIEQNGTIDGPVLNLVQSFLNENLRPALLPSIEDEEQPDFEQIADFVDGVMAPAERAAFEQLLITSPMLQDRVSDLQVLKAELQQVAPLQAQQELLAPQAQAAAVPTKTAVAAPPMLVQSVPDTGAKAKAAWWQRFLGPIQTFGSAAVAALLVFLIGVSPLRNQLLTQQNAFRAEQNQRETKFQNEVSTARKATRNAQRNAAAARIAESNAQNEKRTVQTKLQEAQKLTEKVRQDSERRIARNERHPNPKTWPARPTTKPLPPAKSFPDIFNSSNTQTSGPNSGNANEGTGKKLNRDFTITSDDTNLSITESKTLSLDSKPNDGDGLILKQGKHHVRIEKAQLLSPAAEAAWSAGVLPVAPAAARLESIAEPANGLAAFHSLSPVATVIRELKPTLVWDNVPQATSYTLTLRDETQKTIVFQTENLTTTQYAIPQELTRGHIYRWEVQALDGDKIIAFAPQPPAYAARFEVMSESGVQKLEVPLRAAGNSPLQRSLILAGAGLLDEARHELGSVRK